MQGLIDQLTPGGQLKTIQLGKARAAFEQAVLEWQPLKLTWVISAGSPGAVIQVNGHILAEGEKQKPQPQPGKGDPIIA